MGSHPQVGELLLLGTERFGLSSPPRLKNIRFSLFLGGIYDRILDVGRELDEEFSSTQKLFTAALKSTLLCADAAGSALPAKNLPVREWLAQRLVPSLSREDLETVVSTRLRGADPRPFQNHVRRATTNTVLVTAGCGTGKTAAAYLWAAERAAERRLFFCYPTTATASAGFCGYLHDPDFDAVLKHSRSSVDYRLLEDMPAYSETEKEIRAFQLESLDTWPIPAVVCTAHTVLGLLQNVRTGIYAWPSLVRSAFVFDEVHAYPDRLFAHLIKFLEVFRSAPVLLMTATLPPHRRQMLEIVARARGGLFEVTGPPERERAPRYLLERTSEHEAWDQAARVLDVGGKVLWVCNTVARAIAVVRQALNNGFPVEPFHSRYRYRDRLVRQHKIVDGFAPGRPALLAVTTQVAEISLDLSADLLVSELAPPAAMIQRMGRLNRREEYPSQPKSALFIRPPNALPYAKGVDQEAFWSKSEGWVDILADGSPKSQSDLARVFLTICDVQPEAIPLFFDWIDDPWHSRRNRHTIIEPGYTIELVREEDKDNGRNAEIAIPMPFPHKQEWHRWAFRGRYLEAPAGVVKYDDFIGAEYGQEEPEPIII